MNRAFPAPADDIDDAIERLIDSGHEFTFADIMDGFFVHGESPRLVVLRLHRFVSSGQIVRSGFNIPACKHERATPVWRAS